MLLEAVRGAGRERLETLQEFDEGSLVVARAEDGSEALLFVPRTAEAGARERERLELLRGPGIPLPGPDAGTPGEAIVLSDAAAARPLALAGRLPDAVWRPGLVRLLSTLSHAHGHGWVHGRIARGHVLADPSGEFWIHGWAGARSAVGRGPFQTGIDDVGEDLRDLGVAFLRCFADAPPAAEPLDDAAVRRGCARVATFDAELARVLARLAAGDPREGYESATEVLADLGEPDESLPDPFERPPFVGRTAVVRAALRHAERAGTRDAWLASFEIVGAAGSGKSRLLAEIARAARERGLVVLQAHGGAPDQPWGAVGSFARQMVARLPADHPLRADRGVRVLVGDAPSPVAREADAAHGDGASAALADLATEAFRGSRALLLLDDEDALSSHALQVWRGLGRHVAAASGSSQAPGVLLVTTSARPSEHELIIPRERVELPDLERRHLVPLVAGILTERGKAAILAAELHATVGGRPADVVDQLRDMVARGVLRRVGRRFHCDDFADAVRAGCGVDRFRRAADAAGREGVALASVLAVAGRLRLARDVVGEIAEIPAHRLHAAGEAAVRAGLLARDGATWRVRTESLRVRIAASLADDRRRSLHREILARLLDAPDPDWPAIAHHGRAAGDSRAAGWTRSALDVLRAAGRFDEAATHFDDARVLLDASALDVDLRLAQVDTLLHAGRLGDAIRAAEALLADPAATPRHRGAASLALARLHRYDQAWSRVLAVELPVDCGDPVVLARVRLLHATAHAFRGRDDLADREERLALAELPEPSTQSERLDADQLELEYNRRVLSHARPEPTLKKLVQHVRRNRARREHFELVLGLVRIANLLRNMQSYERAGSALKSAWRVATRQAPSNALLLVWIQSGWSLLARRRGNNRLASFASEQASVFAGRTGAPNLALNKRICSARVHVRACISPGAATSVFVRSLAEQAEGMSADQLAMVSLDLGHLFYFFGHHGALAVLERRTRDAGVNADQADAARYWMFMSTCANNMDLDSPQTIVLSDVHSVKRCYERVDSAVFSYAGLQPHSGGTCQPPSATLALLAWLLRRGTLEDVEWPPAWTSDFIREQLASAAPACPAAADLILSLIISRHPVADEMRGQLVSLAGTLSSALPRAIEWRRALAYARVHWDAGRYVMGAKLAAEAERQLRAMAGTATMASIDFGLRCVSALDIRIRARDDRAHVVTVQNRSRVADAWGRELADLCAHRVVSLVYAHERELELLLKEYSTRTGHRWTPPTPREAPRSEAHILVRASTLCHDSRAGLESLSAHVRAGGRLAIAVRNPPDGRCRSPLNPQQLPEEWGAVVLEVGPICADPARRVALFEAALTEAGVRAILSDDAVVIVRACAWPGGFGQMEAVAQQLRGRPAEEIAGSTLQLLGILPTADEGRVNQATRARILECLGQSRLLSSSEIAAQTDIPTRTIVRALRELSEVHAVVRVGRARATRYRLPLRPDG